MLANGGHDHVGLQRHGFEICSGAVADRHGGIFLQQHQRHRFAYDVAAAYDHGMFAAQLVALATVEAFQHLHAAVRRAGPEPGLADHERAGAGDVKTVNVLGR